MLEALTKPLPECISPEEIKSWRGFCQGFLGSIGAKFHRKLFRWIISLTPVRRKVGVRLMILICPHCRNHADCTGLSGVVACAHCRQPFTVPQRPASTLLQTTSQHSATPAMPQAVQPPLLPQQALPVFPPQPAPLSFQSPAAVQQQPHSADRLQQNVEPVILINTSKHPHLDPPTSLRKGCSTTGAVLRIGVGALLVLMGSMLILVGLQNSSMYLDVAGAVGIIKGLLSIVSAFSRRE